MVNIQDALISIRPNFAEAILAGKKTVEIRRRIPALQVGTRLWIYATRPLGAIIGTAIVAKIIEGTPTELWKTCMDQM
ncbi:MAG: ASCH domain-containing protein, partial [Candidatus Poribacteria bacterium]|nr:ASCH domain-containing protein [Candidatus Poribacteria bacterium]